MSEKEREICEFEMNFKKSFMLRSNLSNDDMISWRPGLKTGAKNDIFSPDIGSGFVEPGGIRPRKIPRSNPRFFFPRKRGHFLREKFLGPGWSLKATNFFRACHSVRD